MATPPSQGAPRRLARPSLTSLQAPPPPSRESVPSVPWSDVWPPPGGHSSHKDLLHHVHADPATLPVAGDKSGFAPDVVPDMMGAAAPPKHTHHHAANSKNGADTLVLGQDKTSYTESLNEAFQKVALHPELAHRASQVPVAGSAPRDMHSGHVKLIQGDVGGRDTLMSQLADSDTHPSQFKQSMAQAQQQAALSTAAIAAARAEPAAGSAIPTRRKHTSQPVGGAQTFSFKDLNNFADTDSKPVKKDRPLFIKKQGSDVGGHGARFLAASAVPVRPPAPPTGDAHQPPQPVGGRGLTNLGAASIDAPAAPGQLTSAQVNARKQGLHGGRHFTSAYKDHVHMDFAPKPQPHPENPLAHKEHVEPATMAAQGETSEQLHRERGAARHGYGNVGGTDHVPLAHDAGYHPHPEPRLAHHHADPAKGPTAGASSDAAAREHNAKRHLAVSDTVPLAHDAGNHAHPESRLAPHHADPAAFGTAGATSALAHADHAGGRHYSALYHDKAPLDHRAADAAHPANPLDHQKIDPASVKGLGGASSEATHRLHAGGRHYGTVGGADHVSLRAPVRSAHVASRDNPLAVKHVDPAHFDKPAGGSSATNNRAHTGGKHFAVGDSVPLAHEAGHHPHPESRLAHHHADPAKGPTAGSTSAHADRQYRGGRHFRTEDRVGGALSMPKGAHAASHDNPLRVDPSSMPAQGMTSRRTDQARNTHGMKHTAGPREHVTLTHRVATQPHPDNPLAHHHHVDPATMKPQGVSTSTEERQRQVHGMRHAAGAFSDSVPLAHHAGHHPHPANPITHRERVEPSKMRTQGLTSQAAAEARGHQQRHDRRFNESHMPFGGASAHGGRYVAPARPSTGRVNANRNSSQIVFG